MHVLITGGTGLIGRRLCAALSTRGDNVTVLSRRPQMVSELCGVGVNSIVSLDQWTPELVFDAVINLAGEPIVDARWTDKRKQILLDSRVALTKQVVKKIVQITFTSALSQNYQIDIYASAIGIINQTISNVTKL